MKNFIKFFLTVTLVFLFSHCDVDINVYVTVIQIAIDNSTGTDRSFSSEEIEAEEEFTAGVLSYEIKGVNTANGDTLNKKMGSPSISFPSSEMSLGTWNMDVNVYNHGKLFARGEKTIKKYIQSTTWIVVKANRI